jgi:hypothetical protein
MYYSLVTFSSGFSLLQTVQGSYWENSLYMTLRGGRCMISFSYQDIVSGGVLSSYRQHRGSIENKGATLKTESVKHKPLSLHQRTGSIVPWCHK